MQRTSVDRVREADTDTATEPLVVAALHMSEPEIRFVRETSPDLGQHAHCWHVAAARGACHLLLFENLQSAGGRLRALDTRLCGNGRSSKSDVLLARHLRR